MKLSEEFDYHINNTSKYDQITLDTGIFEYWRKATARLETQAATLLEALQSIYLGTSEDHTLAIADEAIRKGEENVS